jgi:hypothetical protein
MEPLEELKRDVRDGTCIAVVGAGVSVALSGADPRASWPGFLQSGIDYAKALGKVDADQCAHLRAWLDESAGGEAYLEVAALIVEALGGHDAADFSQWLRTDIGYLSVRNKSLAEAIGRLNIPIITTNYDDLLETALNRDHVTWLQGPQFQLVLGRKSRDIGHLHGYWKEPRSIVLTSDQYKLMLKDREMELLRQAMVSVNSLIYLGFGEGISDPNFGHLRDWTCSAFPNQEMRHYRLCMESERANLLEEHRNERILPITYGSRYEDMDEFLRSLAPAPEVAITTSPHMQGISLIEEQVRESAVLSAHVKNPDEARITDLLIPPVLLTVTHDQYVAAAREDKTARQKRCSLDIEIKQRRLLLSGKEHVGVSSALLWMSSQICLQHPEYSPVTIDYMQLSTGHPNPLRRTVIRHLRGLGHQIRDDEAPPPTVLVLDNVHPGKQRLLGRVIEEVQHEHYAHVLIGCKVGTEADIAEALAAANHPRPFQRRYVGRLSKADVRSLVTLVDAGRSKEITEKAVEVVRAHRLPSTPFTFSMIISALLRGEALLAMTSPTALLDAYIDLLLGRGALDDDSRWGLDAFNRGYVLAKLAERFVHRKAGSLRQTDAVEELQNILEELDWDEEPVNVLTDMQHRHIVVLRGGEVSFARVVTCTCSRQSGP